MRPNLSMAFTTASRACFSFVTSSGSLSNWGWSAIDDGSRAVATTASPLARTASSIKAPNPRVAPVMNQIFMCHCLLLSGAGSGEHLRELDEVPPRVGDKCQPAADDGKLKWLGDDRH